MWHVRVASNFTIKESVDSLCRDGTDTPIVRVHRKAFLTRERSRSKPFWAPSYSIPALLLYLSCLDTATTISSFCGFWHCHPYIPQHFLNVFNTFTYSKWSCVILPHTLHFIKWTGQFIQLLIILSLALHVIVVVIPLTFWFRGVINDYLSSHWGYIEWLHTTDIGQIGEEVLIWITFTTVIIHNINGVARTRGATSEY